MTKKQTSNEVRHNNGSSPKKSDCKVPRADHTTIDEAVQNIKEFCEDLAKEIDKLEPNETTRRYKIPDNQRGILVAQELHEILKYLKEWKQVLVELLVKDGLSQRQIANDLGVSTNTVNRWLQKPITAPLANIELEKTMNRHLRSARFRYEKLHDDE